VYLSLVIFNLIDTAQLIDRGWKPVIDTTNATLTEQLLSSLDLIETNRTNLTNLALRTPIIRNNQQQSAISIPLQTKMTSNSGRHTNKCD
jgi:hypothetical protein